MAASKNMRRSLSAAFSAAGYQQEEYTVGPAGVLTFSIAVAPEIYGYAAVSFFSKTRKLGLFVGFGYPELKTQTDRCFTALAAQKQLPEMHSVAIPCPAALFPAELYVGRPRGDAIFAEENDYLNESVGVVNDCIFKGKGANVRSIASLRDFLVRDGDPLPWAVFATPNRVVQAAHLLQKTGAKYEDALQILAPMSEHMRGFSDFDNYGDEFIPDVARYFFERN
jgi:hypothetical protein